MKLDPAIRDRYPGIVVGYAIVRGVNIKPEVDELNALRRQVVNELKKQYSQAVITAIPEVVAYRSLFKSMGVDPSRYRPPAEYLLRRALQDRFPKINNVVDPCLIATVKTWIVTGAYDLDKTKGEVRVEIQSKVESFELIDGRIVTPSIGELVLRDDEKLVSSFCLGDAKEVMITPATKNVLVVAWNAPGVDGSRTEEALKLAAEYVTKFSGGSVEELKLLA